MNKKKFNSKKLKYGSVATAFTLLFIAVVILVNVLFSFLSERYLLSVDLTGTDMYDLSDETINALSSLQDDITITILDREDFTYTRSKFSKNVDAGYLNAFPELFSRYEVFSGGKIKVQFIDPYANPTALTDYTTEYSTPAVTDVIVESGKRQVHIASEDFFELETRYNQVLTDVTYKEVAGLQAEQKLTSAILYAVTDKLPKAVFIQGHGESSLESLSSLLVAGNYELINVNLTLEDIPEDATMVVIAGPGSDYTAGEIEKLDEYFGRGGNAIVLFSPQAPKLTNLEVYLQEWGVQFDRTLVMDSERALMYPLNVVPYVQDTDMTADIKDSDALTVAANSRAISFLWEEKEFRTTHAILKTGDSAFGRDIDAGNGSLQRIDEDLAGPFTVAALTVLEDPNTNGVTSKVFFGGLDLADDDYLGTTTYLNQSLFVSAINYFNPDSQSLAIATKTLANNEMTIQSWQGTIILWLLVVILPVLFLVVGVVVWVRRRNM